MHNNEGASSFMRISTRASASDATSDACLAVDREEHNRLQAESFNANVQNFMADQPPEVLQRLDRVVAAVPGLGPDSRVLDVGSGTGALIPHLHAAGVKDILAVDLSEGMLAGLRQRFNDPGTLGNDPGVRTWVGDVCNLPAYQGPFNAAFFNSVFANVADQRAALLAAALQLRPGGHLVISHPLGRAWIQSLHESRPEQVPHVLPDEYALAELIADMPLRMLQYVDLPDFYLATLQVPPGYLLQGGLRRLKGDVEAGFGRGSAEMGVPTANLPPGPLEETLKDLPVGVYFGWARLRPTPENSERPAADFETHKMVMNVGMRPTMEDRGGLTVEVHVLHKFSSSFYGEPLRVIVSGFIRPEMKFSGLDALVARIKTDIGLASAQLDTPQHAPFREEPYLKV